MGKMESFRLYIIYDSKNKMCKKLCTLSCNSSQPLFYQDYLNLDFSFHWPRMEELASVLKELAFKQVVFNK